MARYLVVTIKSWNIENFKKLQAGDTVNEWFLITEKDDLTYERVKEINPRYVFFPHWSWIIPKNIYENFECVVFHMTDLPYGRGGTPLQNLIVRGHTTTKVSAIRAVKELDAGPIYLKSDLTLLGKADEIYRRLSVITFAMIREIVATEPQPVPQEEEEEEEGMVTFQRRHPSESDVCHAYVGSDLNPLTSLEKVYDHIRMLDAEGYPRAYLESGCMRYEFTDAELGTDEVTARVHIICKMPSISQPTRDDTIQQAAVSSQFLANRLSYNEQRGTYDLNEFIFAHLVGLTPRNILDLGCGRGKQLIDFAQKFPKAHITGVDISAQAIAAAQQELKKTSRDDRVTLEVCSMEDFLAKSTEKFDLIISTYALYYATNSEQMLLRLLPRITPEGALCIVGPYGANNQELFSLIGWEHIPPYVLYTSRDFMFRIIQFVYENFKTVCIATMINEVAYTSVDEVMEYWQSTTFYKPELTEVVRKRLEHHFSAHSTFTVSKHVMLCLGKSLK